LDAEERPLVPDRFLAGRAAWVTGGVTGIGRAIACEIARAGANVAIGALPDDRQLPGGAYAAQPGDEDFRQATAAIERAGVKCFAAAFDLRSVETLQAFHAAAVAAVGPIDILVNAAGVCAQAALVEPGDDVWHTVIDIDLNGPYRTIKLCLPGMIERKWGRIVNVASTAATVGFVRHGAYCAAKSGLLGLSRCVALEGAPHGVTCNAISPGSVDTGMTRRGSAIRIRQGGQGATIEENLRRIAESSPQRRLIEAAEIAAFALFLCRDEARGLTMEDVTIAGGALW
jgi:NAD(P)-dependent dehydrogenase (short-subunit alcohol dehydrogenase family)